MKYDTLLLLSERALFAAAAAAVESRGGDFCFSFACSRQSKALMGLKVGAKEALNAHDAAVSWRPQTVSW
jgi:hypothetical protein